MKKLSKAAQAERQEAIERVKEWLAASPRKQSHYIDGVDSRPVIYTTLRHVSASGMSRVIALHIMGQYNDGSPRMIDATWSIGKILNYPVKKTRCGEGLSVGGCGMDMGFHLVYSLGSAIYPNGTNEPHSTRNGEPDSTGGYAIKHEWL